MADETKVMVFKALSDPTRLDIVRQLARCPSQTSSCTDLSEKQALSQPALSHHFAKLVTAGIVSERKNGTQKYYELNRRLLSDSGIDLAKLTA